MLNRPNEILKIIRRRAVEITAEKSISFLSRDRRAKRSIIRKIFSDHLVPDLKVLVNFEDHCFLVNPTDTAVSFTLMEGIQWQRQELVTAIELLKTADKLKTDSIFFDVGANIGTQTVYAILSGEFGCVVSIEAEPQNFELLKRNISMNEMTESVTLCHLAASNQCGFVELNIDERNTGGHSIEYKRSTAETHAVKVEALTIDDICTRQNISPEDVGFIWIDVEGHELSVLEGMANLLEKKVPIVVEFDGSAHDQEGTNRLKEILRKNYETIVDLRTIVRKEGGVSHVPVEGFLPPNGARDLLIY